MHHLFVTPVVAGAVTAGVIAFSPSFSDPHEASFTSEEPIVEHVNMEISVTAYVPLELKVPDFAPQNQQFVPMTVPMRTAKLELGNSFAATDFPFERSDIVLASGPIAEGVAIPLSADAPQLEVAAKRLNMRTGPGTTFKKVDMLSKGTKLEQTGNTKGPWLEVAVVETGTMGWLHSKYLRPLK